MVHPQRVHNSLVVDRSPVFQVETGTSAQRSVFHDGLLDCGNDSVIFCISAICPCSILAFLIKDSEEDFSSGRPTKCLWLDFLIILGSISFFTIVLPGLLAFVCIKVTMATAGYITGPFLSFLCLATCSTGQRLEVVERYLLYKESWIITFVSSCLCMPCSNAQLARHVLHEKQSSTLAVSTINAQPLEEVL